MNNTFVFKRYKIWDDFAEDMERLKKEMAEKGMLNDSTTIDEIWYYAGSQTLIIESDVEGSSS